MNFFQRLFNQPSNTDHLVQCPRCLGKGYVDMDDIKRLNNELKWIPGKCAYCNGKGKVDPAMLNKVDANEEYLVVNLSKKERALYIEGDPATVLRGEIFKAQFEAFIEQIKEMYFDRHMKVEEIVVALLKNGPRSTDREIKELTAYIEKVINSVKK